MTDEVRSGADLRMSWVSSVLGGILMISPVFAGSTRVDILSEDVDATGVVATLTATPVMTPTGRVLPARIVAEVTVPGNVWLDLAPDISWRLKAEAKGLWGPTALVAGSSGHAEASIRLVPTATLVAQIDMEHGYAEPAKLEVRIRSPRAMAEGSAQTIDCATQESRWRCDVPAGEFDLRLRAADFVAHYFWELELRPRETVDLGVLKFEHGSAISGWLVTDDRSPLKSGTTVTATPQVTQAGSPAEQQRRRFLAGRASVNHRGFFHLNELRPGAYVLEIEHPGFVSLRSSPVVVYEASETELAKPLVLTRPAELRLIVNPPTDISGSPWSLTLIAHGVTEPVDVGRTQFNGAWTAHELRPGSYLLIIADSQGSRFRSEEVVIESGVAEQWVDLDFIEVEGLVTLGKEPLSAELAFGGASGLVSVTLEADEGGRFHGALPHSGDWPVDVRSRSIGVHRRLRAVEVEPGKGSSRAWVEIELPSTRLDGEVVDSKGRGVDRATVMAVPVPKMDGDPTERPSNTRTTPGGLFSFEGFEPATYRLQAFRAASAKRESSGTRRSDLARRRPVAICAAGSWATSLHEGPSSLKARRHTWSHRVRPSKRCQRHSLT